MAMHPGVFGSAPAPGEPVSITVVFPPNTYRTLQELAIQTGRSVQQVLADAIARERWYTDEIRKGGRVLVERGPLVFSVSSSTGQTK